MFRSEKIVEFESGLPGVVAFRILGKVDRDDMRAMAEFMLGMFDRFKEVDMLLVFDTDETSTLDASLSAPAIEAQVKSLAKVRNYVVANAPAGVGGFIEAMGRILPVDARHFDSEEQALAWLRRQPEPTGG